MPTVTSYTPAWLSKPNPGHDIFTSAPKKGKETHLASGNAGNAADSSNKKSKPRPRRTIARRGTEVFIAVEREIRWADLVYMKETWEDSEQKKKGVKKGKEFDDRADQYEADHAQGYRTIKTPVADDIRQLVISPNANYLAILTMHTVHIAILPESSHLTALDTAPMRLKTFTLGPTTHVTSQSPICSALWHPLGVNGSCLVTVTEEAVVRVWELSTTDRWSFDRPTLAIDLQKLIEGTSLDQDFSASAIGTNKGFSPYTFDMEVASATFTGRGSGGWSPMTLWIAMRNGGIYALCPLLPAKWSPPPTLIPSLSVSIVSKVASMEDDSSVSQSTKLLSQQQLSWMSDLDSQEPMRIEGPAGEQQIEVYERPAHPGKIPRLQGPLDFDLAPKESKDEPDSELTDIYVIGPKLDADELMYGEEDELEMDDVDQEGLSVGVVCLLTSTGCLSICLDLDGVEAQWLPKTKSKNSRFMGEVEPSLLTFQVMETNRKGEVQENSWPMFSHDVNSRYSFYVTNPSNINFISLSPWVFALETELSEGGAGSNIRIDAIVKGHNSERKRVHTQKFDEFTTPLSAATLLRDPDLGYFLLSATARGPVAVSFEAPEFDFDLNRNSRSPSFESEYKKPITIYEPREVYQPGYALEEQSEIPKLLEKLRHSKYKRLLNEDIRLSPATLTVMTDAHKLLSEETHRLGKAAAEIFRRCESLQIELQSQIKKANDVAARIDAVIGVDQDDGPTPGTNEMIEQRIKGAKDRQVQLSERIERMKRKVTKGTRRELSDKENAWIEEVSSLQAKVFGEENPSRRAKEPWQRFEEVKELKDKIIEQIGEVSIEEEEEEQVSVKVQVPSEIRRAKVAQIMQLLDRESALVEGAKSRLERLSVV
ncbi:hypothetical protein B7494_g5602 [Chlorociboria aeruginascens]|nr:hypothetical protein B7494_g5602 [Chlorociboria aeruginascens]